MISFTLITSTPGVLATNLVNRGVLKQITDPDTGKTVFVGVWEGLEWIEVPNPIITTLAVGTPTNPDGTPNPSYVPPVMDTRHCYLVKIVRAANDDQTSGLTQTTTTTDAKGNTITTWLPLLQRTKLGVWVANNSTLVTLTSADGRSWPSRQVGTNFWFVESPDFGVWQ